MLKPRRRRERAVVDEVTDVPPQAGAVLLHLHHSVVQRFGSPLVPIVDVLVRPIATPFNPQRVVNVVADHHEPAVGGSLIQVEVVLVADVIVPVSHENFHRGQTQKPIHVEDRLQRALELAVAGRSHGVTQVTNRRVVVCRFVGFQFVRPLLVVPGGGEFVGLRVVSKIRQIGRIRAFPKVAVGMLESFLQELLVDVLHVDVQPPVLVVDVQAHVADPRCDVALRPHVFPHHPGPQHRGVVVVSVQVQLFKFIPLASLQKGVEADLEAFFGCSTGRVSAQPDAHVADRVHALGTFVHERAGPFHVGIGVVRVEDELEVLGGQRQPHGGHFVCQKRRSQVRHVVLCMEVQVQKP